jgi:hypothetical protein
MVLIRRKVCTRGSSKSFGRRAQPGGRKCARGLRIAGLFPPHLHVRRDRSKGTFRTATSAAAQSQRGKEKGAATKTAQRGCDGYLKPEAPR